MIEGQLDGLGRSACSEIAVAVVDAEHAQTEVKPFDRGGGDNAVNAGRGTTPDEDPKRVLHRALVTDERGR